MASTFYIIEWDSGPSICQRSLIYGIMVSGMSLGTFIIHQFLRLVEMRTGDRDLHSIVAVVCTGQASPTVHRLIDHRVTTVRWCYFAP